MTTKYFMLAFCMLLVVVLTGCRGDAGSEMSAITVKVLEATTNAQGPQSIAGEATCWIAAVSNSASGMAATITRQLTSPNGVDGESFVFDEIPTGNYNIIAEAPGYTHPTDATVDNQTAATSAPQRVTGTQRSIWVENGVDYTMTLYLQKTNQLSYGTVKGRVTGLTADGVDAGAIANCVVAINGRTAKTDSQGNYRIESLPVTGNGVAVNVVPPNEGSPLWTAWSDSSHQVVVAEGGVDTVYDIVLNELVEDQEQQNATIKGQVIAVQEDDSSVVIEGYDYTAVAVYIYEANSNTPVAIVACESNGVFEAGVYTTRYGKTFKVVVTAPNAVNEDSYVFTESLLPNKTLVVPPNELKLLIKMGTVNLTVFNASQAATITENNVATYHAAPAIQRWTADFKKGNAVYSASGGEVQSQQQGTISVVLPYGLYELNISAIPSDGSFEYQDQSTTVIVSKESQDKFVTMVSSVRSTSN